MIKTLTTRELENLLRCGWDRYITQTEKVQENKDVVKEFNAAGFKKSEIKVELVTDGSVVVITGNSEKYGRVYEEMILPYHVSEQNVSVKLEDGILTVTVKCPEESKPRLISIQ